MTNRLNFTEQMKMTMRKWNGKVLISYTENDETEYITKVRFLIDDKTFDLDNGYVLYTDVKGDKEELSCFSCIEMENDSLFSTSVVDGKCKENLIHERIQGVYIVRDTEKEIADQGKEQHEFIFETALILQTEYHCYAFWRHILFDTIEIAVCNNMESVLKTIKSMKTIQEEKQAENPCTVQVERFVEKL